MLKIPLLIPPVVALAIAGTWLGTQRQSISALERENVVLQKAIATRTTGSPPDSPRVKPTSHAKATKEKEPIDWKKIAAQFAETRQAGGMGDMKSMMRFQQRLQTMSKEELLTAFDEIAALDLPDESRELLEQMLIGPLVQKDPELVLTKFIDRLDDNQGAMGWTLSNAMQEWAKKDPARAMAWFDQQIAAGKFDAKSLDGKSQPRIQFEGALVNTLLSSDPDTAGRRLGAMPEDQRDDVLNQFSFQRLKDEDQLAFADLVRSQVPAKDQAKTIAQQASRLLGEEGYSDVTAYLDRIKATPEERTASALQASESRFQSLSRQKKISREDLDAMRQWVATQSPESADTATGKILATASRNGRKTTFADAAELAVQYHDSSGNDEVLASFLEGGSASGNKEEARVLAGKISDEKRRGKILENLK